MASDDDDDANNGSSKAIASNTKAPPTRTWSPSETLSLIDAYQEKWEQLKRGLLRASHWDDVARSLASRSATPSTTKSSVQCRHKLEKLRRRYRSECRLPRPSLWPFFRRMDLLERGPDALRSGPPAASTLPDVLSHRSRLRSHEILQPARLVEEDEEEEDSDQPPPAKIRSLKRVRRDDQRYRDSHKNGYACSRGEPPAYETTEAFHKNSSGAASGMPRKAASSTYTELASVIRSLGEGFLHIEQLKIQMHRETERFRADMEVRRTEMVLESQRQIADLFLSANGNSCKKNEDA